MKYDAQTLINLFIFAGIPGTVVGFIAFDSKPLQAILFVLALLAAVAQLFYSDVLFFAWLLVFSLYAFVNAKLFERFL